MVDRRPLALRYRPQTFSDIVGNELTTEILINSIKFDKVRFAYFMSGCKGSGKTTISRIFAKAVNCTKSVNGEPCNKCQSCVSINSERSLDVIEIDAASENSVASIRELTSSIQYAPSYSKYKVIILDEVHALSSAAANALLKTLEEPPSHVIFIFATTDPQKVIETIKSRCMIFHFERLDKESITNRLKYIIENEKLSAEDSALDIIAGFVNGAMRDAITILDQASIFSDKVTEDVIIKLLRQVSVKDIVQLFSCVNDFSKSSSWVDDKIKNSSPISIVYNILDFFSKLLFIKSGAVIQDLSKDLHDMVRSTVTNISFEQVMRMINYTREIIKDIRNIDVIDSRIFLLSLVAQYKIIIEGKNVESSNLAEYLNSSISPTLGNGSVVDMIRSYFLGEEIKNIVFN